MPCLAGCSKPDSPKRWKRWNLCDLHDGNVSEMLLLCNERGHSKCSFIGSHNAIRKLSDHCHQHHVFDFVMDLALPAELEAHGLHFRMVGKS